ncbi:hypothetical protein EXN51_16385 [Agrobacterium fabrum]|uniref:Uncharacterized protein n=1 Tax=Agrobacterium fabrum (strain C58 / ATCC 33970) TaxID=176299 RepID=Q8UKR5_AGRFC|nr:hypothetical protein Atu5034 [Agrobacterium fabrum str. C58]TRB28217.1 hypothetical protein EXN51_16385 [Agrobacterium fabrum]
MIEPETQTNLSVAVLAVAVIRHDLLLECAAVFGHAKPPKLGVQLSGVSSFARAFSFYGFDINRERPASAISGDRG